MVREQVKARQVGGSLVITLTKPVAEEVGIQEGDSLIMETINERIIVRKETTPVTPLQKAELELEILEKRNSAFALEMELAVHEHNESMPSAHPGIEDALIMKGAMAEWSWQIAKLDLAIAQKKLEIFEMGGNAE